MCKRNIIKIVVVLFIILFFIRVIYIYCQKHSLHYNINKTEDINLNGLSVNEILQQMNHSECV